MFTMCSIELMSTLLGDFLQHFFLDCYWFALAVKAEPSVWLAACFFLLTILTFFPRQICKTMQVYNINTSFMPLKWQRTQVGTKISCRQWGEAACTHGGQIFFHLGRVGMLNFLFPWSSQQVPNTFFKFSTSSPTCSQ